MQIANNILHYPSETKYRRINLNSEVIEKFLLPAIGALEVLFLMGFEEVSFYLFIFFNIFPTIIARLLFVISLCREF